MPSMSYCRHENTANDMQQVVDQWDNFNPEDASDYEIEGRENVIALAREIVDLAG